MKRKRICPFCNSEFTLAHGNQVYCSAECKNNQKAAVQYKLYGILKEFRKGYLANFKLLEKLLPKPGKKTYTLTEINSYGFKHNCFYGAFSDSDGKTWYRVGNYSFAIFKKDEILSIIITNQ